MAEERGKRQSKRTARRFTSGSAVSDTLAGCVDANLVRQVQHLVRLEHFSDRLRALRKWYREGGVMIMGYEKYRVLSQAATKAGEEEWRKELKTILVDPGWIPEGWHHLNQV